MLASISESKDWQCLPRSVDECIEVQRVRVAKESPFGSAKVWSRKADVDERVTPAKRRVAGIGGVIPRPEESLPRAPAPAVPPLWAPARLWPKLNAYATAGCASRKFGAAQGSKLFFQMTRKGRWACEPSLNLVNQIRCDVHLCASTLRTRKSESQYRQA